MPQPVFKRRTPLIVATACGLAASLLAYPLLQRQVHDRVTNEHYAQLSRATAAAAQMSSDTQRSLQARALELNLPSTAPGCSEALHRQLQAIQLQTPGVHAALRIQGNRITCASLPLLLQTPPLPAAHHLRENGVNLWPRLQLGQVAGMGSYTLLEQHQLGLLLKPEEQFSRFFDDNASVAIYESTPPFHASLRSTNLPDHWLQAMPAGTSEQYSRDADSGDLVVRRLSSSGQTILLASRSAALIDQAIEQNRRYLWPQALLIGLACMVLTLLLYPRQGSSRRELERALQRRQLVLLYQPVVDLHSGRCIGAEALMRWRQNDGVLLGPDAFIPLAEHLGMADRITARACQVVGQELPALLSRHPDFHIGLNLSAQELSTHQIVQRLGELRQQLRLPPGQLMVELTESCLADHERALPVINQLRANGIGVAIDDFGTGYCSLSYLATYPFDVLKIDKSFVNAAGTDAIIGPIAEHIVTLSHSLGVTALAEGIETADQARKFRDLGVSLAQGYFFGAPMPLSALIAKMEKPTPF